MTTDSSLPKVNSDTIEGIIAEVFAKNEYFGVPDFMSTMKEENYDMCLILYSFIDSISDSLSERNEEEKEELSAVAKISCHLMYKSMVKQIEINQM